MRKNKEQLRIHPKGYPKPINLCLTVGGGIQESWFRQSENKKESSEQGALPRLLRPKKICSKSCLKCYFLKCPSTAWTPTVTALPKQSSAFACTFLAPRSSLPPEATHSNVNWSNSLESASFHRASICLPLASPLWSCSALEGSTESNLSSPWQLLQMWRQQSCSPYIFFILRPKSLVPSGEGKILWTRMIFVLSRSWTESGIW